MAVYRLKETINPFPEGTFMTEDDWRRRGLDPTKAPIRNYFHEYQPSYAEVEVKFQELIRENPHLRRGQAIMTVLSMYNSRLYSALVAEGMDIWERTVIPKDTLEYIVENWDATPKPIYYVYKRPSSSGNAPILKHQYVVGTGGDEYSVGTMLETEDVEEAKRKHLELLAADYGIDIVFGKWGVEERKPTPEPAINLFELISRLRKEAQDGGM